MGIMTEMFNPLELVMWETGGNLYLHHVPQPSVPFMQHYF